MVVQGRPHQQRRDHSLFHACQCHLLQTGTRLCPQLPGDHLHETDLLWQLLRICKLLKYRNWFTAVTVFKKIPKQYALLFLVLLLRHLSPYSSPQLWGVIKQGYRCKGEHCALLCNTSIFGRMSASLKMGRGTHLSCLVGSRYSEAICRHCSVVLCCTQRAEPCSTCLQSEPQFFPPPPSLRRSESYLFAWQWACKGLRLAFADEMVFKEKCQCV